MCSKHFTDQAIAQPSFHFSIFVLPFFFKMCEMCFLCMCQDEDAHVGIDLLACVTSHLEGTSRLASMTTDRSLLEK